jgi:hypothetical protein
MPGNNIVVVEHVLRAARTMRRVRPRTGVYLLVGLAISGWMGFLLLAGVLLAMRQATVPSPVAVVSAAKPGMAQGFVTAPPSAPAPPVASPPVSAPLPVAAPQPIAILAAYEERRRVQEWMRQADAVDYENGHLGAARGFYRHAMTKGWAPAALALALTFDPHELQRRGVTVVGDAATARACYIRASELMNATMAFYISRLPGAEGGKC